MVGEHGSTTYRKGTDVDELETSASAALRTTTCLAMAEWRVSSRTLVPGETYADFAAGLREAADRNPVSERVLLAQFLRSLDKTTRQLVKQRPKPKTLEEAVDKATEIDDSMDNVAQGMQNTRQSFPTAQTSHVVIWLGLREKQY
ncbi:hypothetical protein F441_01630 [Phytophthora nicotianae CJ01A1]|uniref:Uncharacterized protein n=1 Tax=Phytophthora nicotianae CJ01A1 TaxID=1317063 RepID=W2XSL3_PHYNI|nr:hypothetical protein F441_01630 [Phytophthora nicotianae CJ01A1]